MIAISCGIANVAPVLFSHAAPDAIRQESSLSSAAVSETRAFCLKITIHSCGFRCKRRTPIPYGRMIRIIATYRDHRTQKALYRFRLPSSSASYLIVSRSHGKRPDRTCRIRGAALDIDCILRFGIYDVNRPCVCLLLAALFVCKEYPYFHLFATRLPLPVR